MSSYYREHMLVQTCLELGTQISRLTQRIGSTRYLEIGDDPNLVSEVENALLGMRREAKSIEPYFDLDITSLSNANVYFALVKNINDALKYLAEVRRMGFGSRQHTYELLEKLRGCRQSIDAVGDLVSINAGMIH